MNENPADELASAEQELRHCAGPRSARRAYWLMARIAELRDEILVSEIMAGAA